MKKVLLIFLILLPFFVSAEVVEFNKCIDGDTFKAKLNNEIITVRLLAVDTPESVHPDKMIEYYGIESSKFTCDKIKNAKKIELEYDSNSEKYDKYDRVLAWVFLDDVLLQDEIIKNGYGKVAYLYNDYKYTNILLNSEKLAQKNHLGIWVDNSNNNVIYIVVITILTISIVIYFKNKLKK